MKTQLINVQNDAYKWCLENTAFFRTKLLHRADFFNKYKCNKREFTVAAADEEFFKSYNSIGEQPHHFSFIF